MVTFGLDGDREYMTEPEEEGADGMKCKERQGWTSLLGKSTWNRILLLSKYEVSVTAS